MTTRAFLRVKIRTTVPRRRSVASSRGAAYQPRFDPILH